MRVRHRWEQWLRHELGTLRLPEGLDRKTVWAVATMFASYADSEGDVTVPLETVRAALGVGRDSFTAVTKFLEKEGIVVVTSGHGRGGPATRSLRTPTGSNR